MYLVCRLLLVKKIKPDTNKIPKHLFQGYLNISNNYFKAPCMPDLTEPNPPELTLFPYTTLFRSCRAELVVRRRPARCGEVRISVGDPHRAAEQLGLDRKSTRLNSSHRCISYAVFCLLKKLNLIPIKSLSICFRVI